MTDRQNKMKEGQHTTSYIKHLAVSGLSSIPARIRSICNLTRKCLEIGNKNIPPIRYASAYIDTQNDYFETKEYEKSEYHYYDFNCICKLQFDK